LDYRCDAGFSRSAWGLHETDPDAVAGWLATAAKVTRAEVQRLKEDLQIPEAVESSTAPPSDPPSAQAPAPRIPTATPARACGPAVNAAPTGALNGTISRDPVAAPKPRGPQLDGVGFAKLWARYDGAAVIIDLSGVPVDEGLVYITPAGGSERRPVEAVRLTLLRVTRAVV